MVARLGIIILLPLLLTACASGSKAVLERECLTNSHKSETYRMTRDLAGGLSEDHVPAILNGMMLLVLPALVVAETLVLPVTLYNDAAFQGECLSWRMGIGRSYGPITCQNWPKGIPKPAQQENQNPPDSPGTLPACD